MYVYLHLFICMHSYIQHIYIYLYMHIDLYVQMYVHPFVYIHVSIPIHIYIHTHLHLYTHIHINVFICKNNTYMHTYTYIHRPQLPLASCARMLRANLRAATHQKPFSCSAETVSRWIATRVASTTCFQNFWAAQRCSRMVIIWRWACVICLSICVWERQWASTICFQNFWAAQRCRRGSFMNICIRNWCVCVCV